MAEQTTSTITVDAEPAAVMAVIADFTSYPEWVQGVKVADIVDQAPDGQVRQVYFELEASPIRDQYTLGYDWVSPDVLRWHLVKGRMMTAMDGAYELRPRDGGTEVTYRLSVDVAIPMIGMLKRKAEKVIIDNALKGLKKRVESLG